MFCRNFPASLWNVYHCVRMNLLGENVFFIEKHWTSIFFSLWRKVPDFGKKNSTTSSFLGFYLPSESFPKGTFFSWKKNKQFANFFEIPRDIFLKAGKNYVPLTENLQRGWKNWILCLRRFLSTECCLFFGEFCLQKLFSDLGWMFFWTLTKKIKGIVKIV